MKEILPLGQDNPTLQTCILVIKSYFLIMWCHFLIDWKWMTQWLNPEQTKSWSKFVVFPSYWRTQPFVRIERQSDRYEKRPSHGRTYKQTQLALPYTYVWVHVSSSRYCNHLVFEWIRPGSSGPLTFMDSRCWSLQITTLVTLLCQLPVLCKILTFNLFISHRKVLVRYCPKAC